jgi:hypothetical protein
MEGLIEMMITRISVNSHGVIVGAMSELYGGAKEN